jgi:hypothetical protein
MTTPIDHQRQRRGVVEAMFAGAAAIATLVLVDAAPLGTGQTTVASGSVRLVDQATDLPAPPPPGIVLRPGMVMPPLPPEGFQMLMQGEEMLASPPPNVPNEVCRYNTVSVPCPPVG